MFEVRVVLVLVIAVVLRGGEHEHNVYLPDWVGCGHRLRRSDHCNNVQEVLPEHHEENKPLEKCEVTPERRRSLNLPV